MLHFKRLVLSDWQQFRSADLVFDDRLTILTGANASGKTTVLNLLARHVGWSVPSLAVPRRFSAQGVIRFLIRLLPQSDSADLKIGSLTYDDGTQAQLMVRESDVPTYEVRIDGQQSVRCFFLPSHRAVYRYQAVSQIPVSRITRDQAFQRVWSSTRERFFGGGGYSPSYHMKEILIAWSIFGRGNQDMAADPELIGFYEGFQDTLRSVLPPTLGFKRLSIRNNEIVMECSSGDFMIDAASGGLSAIIDLAWQVFMFSTAQDAAFTVIIDEIENHLHPVMQKRILQDFLVAFPSVRFIVSTHSPLIVNSVRDAAVYALQYDSGRKVTSVRLDLINHAKSATQILDEVLGVSSTLPAWAEVQLEALVQQLAGGPMNEVRFADFRKRLSEMGLSDYLPHALGKILDARQ